MNWILDFHRLWSKTLKHKHFIVLSTDGFPTFCQEDDFLESSDLANKNARHPVNFEFQKNKEYFLV